MEHRFAKNASERGALTERLLCAWLCRKGREGADSLLKSFIHLAGDAHICTEGMCSVPGRAQKCPTVHRPQRAAARAHRGDPSSAAHKFSSDEKSFVSTEGERRAACLSSCAEFSTLLQKLTTKLQTIRAGPKTSASPGQSHSFWNSIPKMVSASFQALSKVSDSCASKFSFLP